LIWRTERRENYVLCQIVMEEDPAEFLYRDEKMSFLYDVLLGVPEHLILVSNRHILTFNDLGKDDVVLLLST
jgi:diadenosine tetraphosphate (Ap4A) HIT family hydrolase